MNYHYRPPGKNEDKIRELSQLDGDLDLKKKQLEKLRLDQEVLLPPYSSTKTIKNPPKTK
jgi:uridine kinase